MIIGPAKLRMKDMFKKTLIVMTTLSLAACSGGNGGNGGDEDLVFGAEFDQRLADAPVTLTENLPAGSADFNGVFDVAVGTDIDNPQSGARGAASLSADFTTNTLSGSASDFVDQNGDAIAGTVNFDNGIIDGDQTNAVFTTGTSGSIALDTGDTAFDQELTGAFFGDEGEIIQGVTATSTVVSDETVPVIGILRAEQ